MAETRSGGARRGRTATRDDLIHIIGELDDDTAVEILALGPSVAEVEEAFMWIAGEGDVVDRAGRPLAGRTAAIVDILAAEEPDEEQ